ncbi:hypothetical protein ACN09C_14845 [Serratia fonticola]|uniref:hypothetical protein n=1 Tax=Serratia fonticola TaxID=47917 RepID=UPI003B005D9A
MTKSTVTTERLKEIEKWQGSGFCGQSEADHGEIVKICRELLAVRKAQSVPTGKCDPDVFENGKSACLVVISKETAEEICRGITAATGCKVDWHYFGGRVHIKALAPPAPALPGELIDAMAEVIRISDRDHEAWDRAKAAISACRAAMLQPVSQGYTLNSPVIPDGWKLVPVELTEDMVAKAWREALGKCDNETIKRMFAAMLAAAPTPTK